MRGLATTPLLIVIAALLTLGLNGCTSNAGGGDSSVTSDGNSGGDGVTTVTLEVDNVESNGYTFSGGSAPNGLNPTLTLQRGETYVFERISANHPFEIRLADNSPYGVAESNNSQKVTLTVPADAPDTLKYVCSVHPVSMQGTIEVVD